MPIDKSNPRVWVVRLADEPALTDDLNDAKAEAEATPASAAPHLVVDLSALTMINSSNLTQLLRLRKLALERDVKLRLTRPTGPVDGVFHTTGLDKVFDFAADIRAAVSTVLG